LNKRSAGVVNVEMKPRQWLARDMPADPDQPFYFRQRQFGRLRGGEPLKELSVFAIAVGKVTERGAEQLGDRVAGKAIERFQLGILSCHDCGHDAVLFPMRYA
jgi:hypothetical protein